MQSLLVRDGDILEINRDSQLSGVTYTALVIPWIAISLRVYTRLKIQKLFGTDDYLAVISLFVLTTLCAILIKTGTHLGLDTHRVDITPHYLVKLSCYTFTCEILYIITIALTKLSIGFFFLRLTTRNYQKHVINFTIAIVSILSIIYISFTIFQCQPVNYFWRQHEANPPLGTCQTRRHVVNLTYAHAAMNCATDWIFGILPFLFIRKLNLSPRIKLSVVLILSLGFFASIATIIRIIYLSLLGGSSGYTWESINLIKWSIIEPSVSLTAAALATMRPLFQGLFSPKSRLPRLSISVREGYTTTLGDSYPNEFAIMLGLAVSPGVKTTVYAENTLDPYCSRKSAWSEWRESSVGLVSPIWKSSWRGSTKNDDEFQRHNFDAVQSTTSLGLGDLEDGNWIVHRDSSSGITKTTVITRQVGE
ncbi:unnamed protein product [Blumeria hordei]|uniref:Rhodopsin domain-containing protein n=3 Tax=Blumeria TaxID=34372 RepID=A0A383UVB0_BLUHO|nr:integral membrane protein [Blumeria graminis]CCU79798.1 integral membrane protein [Blumeria hordei DH14]SZF03588.1 unnamed protein product [Blumeria hordei]